MRLKNFSAIVVLICLLSTMLLSTVVMPAEASSNLIYVDAKNINDPFEDGSSSHPFNLIQEGVDAANIGDTIHVASGVYYESVQIAKSSISLVGETAGTIIDGNGTSVCMRLYHTPPEYTQYVNISGFMIRNGVKGVTLSRSRGIRLRDIIMIGNTYNFGDYTLQSHDIDTSNTVNGKPIYYYVNQRDLEIPSDAGFVAIVSSTNMTVRNLNLTNNVHGLLLKNTTRSLIENVRVSNNWDGIYLERWSNSNTITNCAVSDNLFMGMYVSTSSSNTIVNNSISGNAYGLFLDSTVYEYVIDNTTMGNTVTGNVFEGNTIVNCSSSGVYMIQSEDNLLYHNNFVSNVHQVYSLNSTDRWDDGDEGNYWDDYSGVDLDKDALGDGPYVVEQNGQDHHPLMGLFSGFSVRWQEETYRVNAISSSAVSGLYFSQPEKAIGFDVGNSDLSEGFCKMSLPISLIGEPYELEIDGVTSTDFMQRCSGDYCFLYFNYGQGEHQVRIVGTTAVAEFSSFLLLFSIATSAAIVSLVVLARRKNEPTSSG